MHCDWQVRRSEFNHDWLKNRFLNRLDAFLERLHDAQPDDARLNRFLTEDLPEWEQHEPEARWLVESVEQEMSPRRFFEQPPLCHCDDETKRWLPEVVHEIWLARYPVRRLQGQARALLAQAQERYRRVQEVLRDQRTLDPSQLSLLREHFGELSQACRKLHDAFSDFDREVKPL